MQFFCPFSSQEKGVGDEFGSRYCAFVFFLPCALRPAPYTEPGYFFGTQNSKIMAGMEIRKLTPNMPL